MSFPPDIVALHNIGPGWIAAAAIFGYLLGSIPFGLIFTRLAGLGDVRAVGSGNTGATNVLRLGNRKIALATLLCDIVKGALPAGFFAFIAFNLGTFAGFFAVIGHIFPIWLKFRGGKGVATYLGVLLAVSWFCALLFALVWLGTARLGRYSSLAALLAAFITPFFAFFTVPYFSFLLLTLLAILIIGRHKDNIKRLLNGTESRINSKKA
ncbi:MAG: glycerol-3-phosphate 1-O-acyltransferase [Candidatus Tokpelaia sp.]|uniref:glycerol-3-phosphate 1-O-acyltransferase PlsY n=1 Tax=Candidatus Tokpelaia sp. TaxID=2233777 RepID=UPI00123C1CAD|nr:glycerol-3-phosphate 1-O-acyltransferase PlsY [Candidatus Tokpelaia sp.]KAA6205824.1 MAG: glycerol-3-phosphate 1-O-acyltransferase [Candidatus Tokpelaia sp.]KAA6207673.1 MAG: glycerol-3-phosphate 1-O-acyltransferase [Candidatus Tokpelaia sp.]KAA6404848.1 acyl-phosphate glycerol 3-phosphate acyltransferase [Candidatus Tokpelaia sp.]